MSWQTPIQLQSLLQAIVHIDGDAFFASCEQAVHPEYRGLPVITGKERGIAASMSYEAKALGVKRGMRLFEVKKLCPQAIILPNDYETYSLFSERLFHIMRRFTPQVEEYSIDEGFADITGLRRTLRMNYYRIAENMKQQIDSELGFTVSVGLAPTKVLAKLASKWKKPNGLTIITGRTLETFLAQTPLVKVWGIGPNTTEYLRKWGLHTALDLVRWPENLVRKHLAKPYQEIWQELQGQLVYEVTTERAHEYYSISKAKTFTPPSSDRNFVAGQLIKNLENACIKARRHHLAARGLMIFLRTQKFETKGLEVKLSRPTGFTHEIVPVATELLSLLFQPGTLYRQTAVVLTGLIADNAVQGSLFEAPLQWQKVKSVYQAIDALAVKYGKHTVFLAPALAAHNFSQHLGERGDKPSSQLAHLRGETSRQRLNVPLLTMKI